MPSNDVYNLIIEGAGGLREGLCVARGWICGVENRTCTVCMEAGGGICCLPFPVFDAFRV